MISWSKTIKWIVGVCAVVGAFLFGKSNANSANEKQQLKEQLSNVKQGHTINQAMQDADDDDAHDLITSFMRDDENN